ncbi:MAG TPA: AMP-binding protein [Thermoleophilaceae bacterium]|nr:AMP-binding protein [Thermoleophilaceae bacterium]
MSALQEQLAYLEASSPFYAERLRGVRERVRSAADLPLLPFTTKEELRDGQRSEPPFGQHLCASRERLVRMHITSGTTGEPVAVGFTRADHEANSAVGGEAFRIAGLRPDDVVAHCLNYALYAGGIADHMALEASGPTVLPVGTGQSRRLLELIPQLGITAIFGTLSYPAYLAARARELGVEPRSLGIRRIVTAGEPGAGLAAVRSEIEEQWGASVADSFGMSDVWSTMGGACEEAEGVHLTVEDHAVLEVVDPDSGEAVPLRDGASGELVWTHLRREASPLLRYRSADLGRVWISPCACGLSTPRVRIDGRRDDMLRVQAVNVYPQAIAAIMANDTRLGRYCVVAEGDPIVPPLRVYVEAPGDVELDNLTTELEDTLRARFTVTRLQPGSLPVAEHKTRIVHRTARGDALPEVVEALRREIAR